LWHKHSLFPDTPGKRRGVQGSRVCPRRGTAATWPSSRSRRHGHGLLAPPAGRSSGLWGTPQAQSASPVPRVWTESPSRVSHWGLLRPRTWLQATASPPLPSCLHLRSQVCTASLRGTAAGKGMCRFTSRSPLGPQSRPNHALLPGSRPPRARSTWRGLLDCALPVKPSPGPAWRHLLRSRELLRSPQRA